MLDVEQRSEAWHAARLGKLTSTTANDILSKTKAGEFTTARRNLAVRFALERLTGKSQERSYQSAAMLAGAEAEPDAILTYEALTGRIVTRTGFLQHVNIAAGASLDGHFDDFAGIVEIKSPIPATHLDYLQTGKVPLDYLRQVTHALWLTGAEWADWMSYQPLFPEGLQTKLVRVWAVDLDIAGYDLQVRAFLEEVDAVVVKVLALQNAAVA